MVRVIFTHTHTRTYTPNPYIYNTNVLNTQMFQGVGRIPSFFLLPCVCFVIAFFSTFRCRGRPKTFLAFVIVLSTERYRTRWHMGFRRRVTRETQWKLQGFSKTYGCRVQHDDDETTAKKRNGIINRRETYTGRRESVECVIDRRRFPLRIRLWRMKSVFTDRLFSLSARTLSLLRYFRVGGIFSNNSLSSVRRTLVRPSEYAAARTYRIGRHSTAACSPIYIYMTRTHHCSYGRPCGERRCYDSVITCNRKKIIPGIRLYTEKNTLAHTRVYVGQVNVPERVWHVNTRFRMPPPEDDEKPFYTRTGRPYTHTRSPAAALQRTAPSLTSYYCWVIIISAVVVVGRPTARGVMAAARRSFPFPFCPHVCVPHDKTDRSLYI